MGKQHIDLNNKTILVTGSPGFIGANLVLRLLREGALDLSLCGHVHKPGARLDGRGRGEICSGSVTRNGVIAEIDYDEKNDVFDCRSVDLGAV